MHGPASPGTTIVHVGSSDLPEQRVNAAAERISFDVHDADSRERALELVREGVAEVVVSRYSLSDGDGLEFLRAVRDVDADIPFVLVATDGDEQVASEAVAAGVDGYLPRADVNAVVERVTDILQSSEPASEPGPSEGERRYRNLLEASPAPINVFDRTGEILYSNQAVADLLGIDHPADLEGDSIFDYIEVADREVARAELASVIEEGETVGPTQMTVCPDDGPCRDIQVATAPGEFRGEPVGQAVIIDVTELREAERELRSERRFIENALDTLNDGFYVVDPDGRLIRWNRALAETTGYTDAELDGMFLDRLIVGRDIPALESGLQTALDEGQDARELTLVTKGGETLPVEARTRRLTDEAGTVIGAAGIARDIAERRERERQLTAQREQLSMLAQTNRLVREINAALVTAESRAEVESLVCERLAGAGPYQFAWIGAPNRGHQRIVPRAAAGTDEGYLDAISISLDDEQRAPVVRAIRTNQVQTNEVTDAAFEPWRQAAQARGFESVIAIPLSFQNARYGVLALYSGRRSDNIELEEGVLGELGETVGAAINTAERKRALLAAPVVDLELELADETEFFSRFAAALDRAITLERITPREDGRSTMYLSVACGETDRVDAVCERFSSIDDWEWVTGDRETPILKLGTTEDGVVDRLATHGSVLESLSATPEHCTLTVQVPESTDVRAFVKMLDDSYDTVRMRSRQQRTGRSQPALGTQLDDLLTDRQQQILELAYDGGYFESPRVQTGQDLASDLGIAGPTFHTHLRAAQRHVFGELLSSGSHSESE
ncbi:PAS domain S-box protein [Haloglomus salinum]|uniref:PAS domain S-box protein n=1 Tax=Haloglomus salinum TaxID=2962673 RepID=UPI0020C9F408|nr:PAS domain S-box protein [Haloglomus salinum]